MTADERQGPDVRGPAIRNQARSVGAWWLCPNVPPCPHGAVFHDTDGDTERPDTCCVEGCTCGHEEAR